jgi:hypothetical protein
MFLMITYTFAFNLPAFSHDFPVNGNNLGMFVIPLHKAHKEKPLQKCCIPFEINILFGACAG